MSGFRVGMDPKPKAESNRVKSTSFVFYCRHKSGLVSCSNCYQQPAACPLPQIEARVHPTTHHPQSPRSFVRIGKSFTCSQLQLACVRVECLLALAMAKISGPSTDWWYSFPPLKFAVAAPVAVTQFSHSFRALLRLPKQPNLTQLKYITKWISTG